MSRWRCRWYRRRLVDYADGVLPQGQRQPVETHLSLCPACGEELAALREVPAALHGAVVPDPGNEFWRQQREAIGRAIRNAPAPPASRWPTWWTHDGWRLEWWGYPLAAAASALIAVAVYHFAASPPVTPPGVPEEELAALDTNSLLSLRELMQTLVPADEQISEAGAEDDVLLAALPLSDFAGSADVAETPQVNDLSDSELEKLDTLVGGFG
jgi:anti-sigma factor RsiW